MSWLESACPREGGEGIESGVQMVGVLQNLEMDAVGLMAGLLQGFMPLSDLESEHIETNFGADVIKLYRSINRMRQLSDLLSVGDPDRSRVETDEENLRKMLIAMVDDVRVVQICLANQLILLRASKSKTVEFQKFQARLTQDVYAPLANRLGIGQLKWELEDLAFRYLHPDTYHALASALQEKRPAREQYIARLVSEIQTHLKDATINAEVQGRPKHIHSIWKKMQRKDLEFEQLWDLRGVRILVHNVEQCYSALSAIHSAWKHVPNEFSDYIAMPKINGYQSIHSVIVGPENKKVEVQIRTYSMHEESELGGAAHWRYKEKLGQDNGIDAKVVWLRQLLDWKNEVMGSAATEKQARDGADDTGPKDSRHKERIYVFTPKGTIVDLPVGSTPIDFAYAIHSEVGHRTRGAKVNGKMVPLNYPLQTAEQVYIQTVKTGGPSRDWLRNDHGDGQRNVQTSSVQTNRARSRILQWFKHADYDQNVSEGRGMLERELHRLDLEDLSYEKINQHTHFHKIDDLLAAIGARDFKLSKALYPFKTIFRPTLDNELEAITKSRQPTKKQNQDSLSVQGVGNLLTRIAKCCQPVPGDEIIGFISSGRGVSIHRINCNNILHIDENLTNRLVEVDWGQQSQSSYRLGLWVTAYHRSGLLHEIIEMLKAANVDVLKVNMETDQEHVTRLQFSLEISAALRPEQLISRLSSIQNVFEVRRD